MNGSSFVIIKCRRLRKWKDENIMFLFSKNFNIISKNSWRNIFCILLVDSILQVDDSVDTATIFIGGASRREVIILRQILTFLTIHKSIDLEIKHTDKQFELSHSDKRLFTTCKDSYHLESVHNVIRYNLYLIRDIMLL